MDLSQHFSTKKTSQSHPIPGEKMVENNAGGFVYRLDSFKQFQRFLILGTEGGTYYVKEKELTIDNARNTIACIQLDGIKVVNEIVRVSDEGRAVKNDAAIFALALCCTFGDAATKKIAYDSITRVCRIGTHIFTFCQNVQALRGWSRGLRKGVSAFYTDKSMHQLSYQLIKYRQRNGWTHRDVLRLCHPKTKDETINNILRWTVGKGEDFSFPSPLIDALCTLQRLDPKKDKAQIENLILRNDLPREALPTEFLNEPYVWEALLHKMPLTALIRNLGKMSSIGILKSDLDEWSRHVIKTLEDQSLLKKARIHPLQVLNALKTYSNGHGDKGSLTWMPVNGIVAALDEAFYATFDNVVPTEKGYILGLDVSGSMSCDIAGMSLSAREASVAMAMVTARTEKYHQLLAFSDGLVGLSINKKSSLREVIRDTERLPFSGTDCSLPIIYAMNNKLKVDTFAIYTDSETWSGNIHPSQALRQYRQKSGIDAKLVVVGMTSTGFTIADPTDQGMLDVVGFDTGTPQAISLFTGG